MNRTDQARSNSSVVLVNQSPRDRIVRVSPLKKLCRRGTLRQRFEEQWVGEPNSGCWLWIGNCVFKRGGPRGTIRDGKQEKRAAQRVAYELYKGPIPKGLSVLHRCDVTLCVNPRHLYLGTHADNMRDMTDRGRALKGDRHHNAKVTCAKAVAIVSDQRSQSKIAAEYGVSQSLISQIKRGIVWSHATGARA